VQIDAQQVIQQMRKFLDKPTDYPLYETCAIMQKALAALEQAQSVSADVQD